MPALSCVPATSFAPHLPRSSRAARVRRVLLAACVGAAALAPAAVAAQNSDAERAAEREAARRDAGREESRREYEDRRARGELLQRDSRYRCNGRNCDTPNADADARGRVRDSRIDTTIALGRRGEASLSLIAGRVTVRGWDRAEARVRAESEGGTVRLEHAGSRVALSEERRGRRGDDTRYDLTLPHGTRLVVRTTSGDVESVDVRGEVEIRTTSGDVRIDGASGRTLFESVSGDVEARGLTGPVRGQSVSGSVTLDRVAGDVEVETVSGEIAVNQARASFVRLETTSGDVDFAGPLDRAGRYEFNSHSGTITLALPPDAGARVSVETFSGDLDTAFPLTLMPNDRGGRPRRFEFTLGAGGARVTAESFSGDVNLRRTGATGATTPRE